MNPFDKDLYDILEVSPTASEEVIKNAYRALVKKWHPDAQPEEKKKKYEEKLKEINLAFEILSDTKKRQEYNRYKYKRVSKTNHYSNIKTNFEGLKYSPEELGKKICEDFNKPLKSRKSYYDFKFKESMSFQNPFSKAQKGPKLSSKFKKDTYKYLVISIIIITFSSLTVIFLHEEGPHFNNFNNRITNKHMPTEYEGLKSTHKKSHLKH